MKKRMLITSIVMVVVLAVALTTSSLAWFSASQNNVTAQNGHFQAGTSESSNVNIAISDELGNFRSVCDLQNYTTGMLPSCPKSAFDFTSNSSVTLNTARVASDKFVMNTVKDSGVLTFDETDGSESTLTSGEYHYYDAAYLVNYDDTKAVSKIDLIIKAKVSQAADHLATPVCLLRVSKRGTGEGATWTHVGYKVVVLAETGNYVVYDFANLTAGDPEAYSTQTRADVQANSEPDYRVSANTDADLAAYPLTATVTIDGLDLAVSATEYAKIDIFMWFDGNALTSNTQETNVDFKLTVKGYAAE